MIVSVLRRALCRRGRLRSSLRNESNFLYRVASAVASLTLKSRRFLHRRPPLVRTTNLPRQFLAEVDEVSGVSIGRQRREIDGGFRAFFDLDLAVGVHIGDDRAWMSGVDLDVCVL